MQMPPPPTARPPLTRTAGIIIVVVAVVGLGLYALYGHSTTIPAASPVTYTVTSCSVAYGFATAHIDVTVSEPLSYIGFAGDFTDGLGDVTGQGIGSLGSVTPGQTYKTTVIYSLTGSHNTDGTCGVTVDSYA